ncbi:SNF5-domain-containing protein [Mycena venus]|uniref:SNF5-domain-containing protein n=1 Tax=Mycena venus TaxID=2733690 RepID=A0A8H7DHF3_9AGAR|nr:SNF5-domain-containing protein [Mycena venus]
MYPPPIIHIHGGFGGSGGNGGESGGSGGIGEGPQVQIIYNNNSFHSPEILSSIQRQNFHIQAHLSELPHDLERRLSLILEKNISRIREESLSVTQPDAPDSALVIRLDFARLIPSKTSLGFLCQVIGSFIALSADEQLMIQHEVVALLPVLTIADLTDIEGGTYAFGSLAAAINPITAIGLYMQTIILYIAAYMIWRLITRSIPSAPGMDTKYTIVVIDILGLEFRLPLERCATFEDFHSLIADRVSKQRHKGAAKYVLSRAYEVADRSNAAVIYPHVWVREDPSWNEVGNGCSPLLPLSVACPWCGQENTQAQWIHCVCGQTFKASAASQMGPRDAPGERSTAFVEELPESSQRTSSSTDFNSFAVEQSVTGAEDDPDELPSFRKVHVIFDDFKGKCAENSAATENLVQVDDVSCFGEAEEDTNGAVRERQARERELPDGQRRTMINGVWHCSNCGCPEAIAEGRRKGPLGDKSQCGTCGKYWHRHRRPRPVEYNSEYEFHARLKLDRDLAKTLAKRKGGAAALRA